MSDTPFPTLKVVERPSVPALGDLLTQTRDFVRHYIVCPREAHYTAIALWIAHCWIIEAFDYTPYLHIFSPAKRCGKSRLLDCLRALCPKAWAVISLTPPVLYRKIERDCPTALIDEIDTVFSGKGDEGTEALRAVLNAGFERRATVTRCVGPKFELMDFNVFCPKALAGIGKLPDTIADRSIPILLARRAPSQPIEKFRRRDVENLAQPLVDGFRAWAESADTISRLKAARPAMPEQLGDRQTDICEPLVAIADLAGGQWPELARKALVEILTGTEADDDSTPVRLLIAIREIFHENGCDRIATHDLLDRLVDREGDEPWANWWAVDLKNQNVKGPASKLARFLKRFGVTAGTIRLDNGETLKGYKRESFSDAWDRYCPKLPA